MEEPENTDEYGDLGQRLRRQTEALLEIANCKAIQTGDIDEAMTLITRLAADVLDVRYANVLRIKGDGITSLLRYDHLERCPLDTVSLMAAGIPRYLETIRSGSVIDASDARNDVRINELREVYMEPMGIYSMLDAGFRIGSEFNGVICMASTKRREWQDDEIRFIVALASQLSLALSNRELRLLSESHANLDLLTCQDALTGIGNRRAFDRSMQQYWNLAVRKKTALALLLIDLDHFKTINDQYGHLAGDQCLRQVAELLHSALRRQSDVLTRIGGEEFGVLLPDTDIDGASALANRMLIAVSNTSIRLPDKQTVSVNFSAGVCCRDAIRHPDKEAFFDDADKALYAAKEQGRGRIVIASGDSQTENTAVQQQFNS